MNYLICILDKPEEVSTFLLDPKTHSFRASHLERFTVIINNLGILVLSILII